MFNNIPPAGFPQIDLSQDVKRINAELSGMASNCSSILTDITAETVTVSGNPITLTDALSADAISVVAEIEPEQDLHGYSKPWSGGSGKNKLPMVLADIKSKNTSGTWSGNAYTVNDVTFTVNTDDDGNVTGIVANGTASAETTLRFFGRGTSSTSEDITFSESFIVSIGVVGSSATVRGVMWTETGGAYIDETETTFSAMAVYGFGLRIANGYTANNVVFYPMIRLATVTDATFEPYSNICPISGMTEVNVTTTDGTDTNTATASLGTTVYGGSVDVTEGSASVEYASVDLGTLTWTKDASGILFRAPIAGIKRQTDLNIPINAICSQYEVVAQSASSTDPNTISGLNWLDGIAFWTTDYSTPADLAEALSGVQLVYKLATPTTLSFTSDDLAMLSGENTISTDAEEVSVEYIKNTLVGRVRRLEEEQ